MNQKDTAGIGWPFVLASNEILFGACDRFCQCFPKRAIWSRLRETADNFLFGLIRPIEVDIDEKTSSRVCQALSLSSWLCIACREAARVFAVRCLTFPIARLQYNVLSTLQKVRRKTKASASKHAGPWLHHLASQRVPIISSRTRLRWPLST